MHADADRLFLEALALPIEVRADLTDRLVAAAVEVIDPEIERSHLEEIRRRIAQIDSGEVKSIPGEQVFASAHALLAELQARARERL
jgi:hypothetical protein